MQNRSGAPVGTCLATVLWRGDPPCFDLAMLLRLHMLRRMNEPRLNSAKSILKG